MLTLLLQNMHPLLLLFLLFVQIIYGLFLHLVVRVFGSGFKVFLLNSGYVLLSLFFRLVDLYSGMVFAQFYIGGRSLLLIRHDVGQAYQILIYVGAYF